jgi:hypothetical protein
MADVSNSRPTLGLLNPSRRLLNSGDGATDWHDSVERANAEKPSHVIDLTGTGGLCGTFPYDMMLYACSTRGLSLQSFANGWFGT